VSEQYAYDLFGKICLRFPQGNPRRPKLRVRKSPLSTRYEVHSFLWESIVCAHWHIERKTHQNRKLRR
jgi:hypothetical protein